MSNSFGKVMGVNSVTYRGIVINHVNGKYLIGDVAMARQYDTLAQCKLEIDKGFNSLANSLHDASNRLNNNTLSEDK